MDSARALLDSWARWVEELADHPLDFNEYEELLSTRTQLSIALEVDGSSSLWAEADEVDSLFESITTESPQLEPGTAEWWTSRLPTSQDHRVYLARTSRLSNFQEAFQQPMSQRNSGDGTDCPRRRRSRRCETLACRSQMARSPLMQP